MLLCTCTKNNGGNTGLNSQEEVNDTALEKSKKNFSQYYCFVGSGDLLPIESPNIAPTDDYLPWTEATRISGLTLAYDAPIFLINKIGLLLVQDGNSELPKFSIHKDAIFSIKTADGFYKTDLGQFIRLYTNTIFSSLETDDLQNKHVSLLRYNSVSGSFIPVINYSNFKLTSDAQLVSLDYKTEWIIAFKTEKEGRVSFDYFSFNNFDELVTGKYSKITQEEFRRATQPIDINYNSSNNDINIVSQLIRNCGYQNISVEFFSADLNSKMNLIYSPKKNSNTDSSSEDVTELPEITATLIKYQKNSDDSNFYALLLNNGKLFLFDTTDNSTQSFELPTLPSNMVYTYFSIYNNIIIAGWEEQSFFNVRRTGVYVQNFRNAD